MIEKPLPTLDEAIEAARIVSDLDFRTLRRSSGIGAMQLAARAGVHVHTIWDWERGVYAPRPCLLYAVLIAMKQLTNGGSSPRAS